MAPSGAPDTGPEQPDTAAIREWYVGRRRPSSPTMIAALCDALDAARAESEALRREQIHAVRLAEAAEARHARESAAHARTTAALFDFVERHDQADLDLRALQDRLEAAEARIAELEAPFHRVRPRPEGTCHRNLHYPPANSECCWDYR